MFQVNSRLFLLLIVSRGSKKRNNNIIIDIIRKSKIGINFLIAIIFINEIIIIRKDIINKSQNN